MNILAYEEALEVIHVIIFYPIMQNETFYNTL